MIDIRQAEQVLEDHLKKYDKENGQTKLKIVHTREVVRLSEMIATDLRLDKENIDLAKLIALLHDIGRFEQIRRFGDFSDHKNEDHADAGAEMLFKDGLIREFITEDRYDTIIERAIRNHNKYSIEKGLTELELLHAKIIRDADKADNFRVKVTDPISDSLNSTPEIMENDSISEDIYQVFMARKQILCEDRKTDMDTWVSYIAFIFDMNFKFGCKFVKEHDYINRIVDRIDYKHPDTRRKMEDIRKCAIEYVEERLSKEG